MTLRSTHFSVWSHKRLVAVQLLLWLFAGILYIGQADPAYGEGMGVAVTDSLGREVRLEGPAKSIVALAPHIVENVYSAGAGEQLVATVEHSDYPPEAKELPRLGNYHAVNLERILALEPDLVLMWASGHGERTQHQLERLGLTVYMAEPSELEDVAREVRAIGVLAGTSAVAEQAADDYLAKLARLKARYTDAAPVSVFYQIWNDPLQTLSGGHLVSDIIELCGGHNIYAEAATLAPTINMESLLSRNPEAIIASGMGDARPEWLSEWSQWPGLTAVQNDNLFFVPPDIIQRHTLRITSGAEQVCSHIAQARAHVEGNN